MESRKVQKVGGGTLTVSLPKAWAERQGLTAGRVVHLHPSRDGVLLVQVGDADPATPFRARVDLETTDPERLERTLRAAYAAGIEELTMTVSDSFTDAQRRVLTRVTRTLTGLTVAEQTPDSVTVRTLLDPEEVSLRQSVRHLSFVACSMHREATDALCGDGSPTAIERDDQADRLFAMIDRQFASGLARLDTLEALGLSRPDLFACWQTARELERVADHAERLGAIAADLDGDAPALGEEVAALAEHSREVVETAVRAAIDDSDSEAAQAALDDRDAVREAAATLDRRLFESSEAPYRLSHAVDRLRRTAEHGGNIAELALRASFRPARDGSHVAFEDASDTDAVSTDTGS